MPKVALYNKSGKQVGEVELNDNIFGLEPNTDVLHQVVTAQLANARQGTQSALTRAEVSGGGIKPWRQKGTGRARQGSIRAPQWKHGGIVFAPKPRCYRQSVNKKVRRLAIKSALSAKVLANEIIVLDNMDLAAAKTKEVAGLLKAFGAKNALLVNAAANNNVELGARNIPNVASCTAPLMNAYDVLKYEKLIITQDAVNVVEEVFA